LHKCEPFFHFHYAKNKNQRGGDHLKDVQGRNLPEEGENQISEILYSATTGVVFVQEDHTVKGLISVPSQKL